MDKRILICKVKAKSLNIETNITLDVLCKYLLSFYSIDIQQNLRILHFLCLNNLNITVKIVIPLLSLFYAILFTIAFDNVCISSMIICKG